MSNANGQALFRVLLDKWLSEPEPSEPERNKMAVRVNPKQEAGTKVQWYSKDSRGIENALYGLKKILKEHNEAV